MFDQSPEEFLAADSKSSTKPEVADSQELSFWKIFQDSDSGQKSKKPGPASNSHELVFPSTVKPAADNVPPDLASAKPIAPHAGEAAAKPSGNDSNTSQFGISKPGPTDRREAASLKKPFKLPGDGPEISPDRIRIIGGNDEPAKPETDFFREQLKKAGIDPEKRLSTRIVLYEPLDAHDSEGQHPAMVRNVINGKDHGLVPGADVSALNPKERTPEIKLESYLKGKDPIKDWVTAYSVAAMDDLSKFIGDTVGADAKNRVINVSQGFSPCFASRALMQEIEKNPDKFSSVIKGLLGEADGNKFIAEQKVWNEKIEQSRRGDGPNVLIDERDRTLQTKFKQSIVDSVEKSLDKNKDFQDAMQRYRDCTKDAADKGVAIVVATANDGFWADMERVKLKPGSEYNWYAMSDHVIAVGGSDTKNTPGDRSDDGMYAASSHGTDRWKPTIVAQGQDIPDRGSPNGRIQGTSFAAPTVSACISLMLEQNPKLSFNEIKTMLEKNATALKDIPATWQGAGALDVTKAVLAARASRH